jgi:hypothetical protein
MNRQDTLHLTRNNSRGPQPQSQNGNEGGNDRASKPQGRRLTEFGQALRAVNAAHDTLPPLFTFNT